MIMVSTSCRKPHPHATVYILCVRLHQARSMKYIQSSAHMSWTLPISGYAIWTSLCAGSFPMLHQWRVWDFLGKFVIAYINNILIYSENIEKHRNQVCKVLFKLKQNQLFVKGEKCEIHTNMVMFLGYIISREGTSMDKQKVKAVTEWPIPHKVKELLKFLGFANFYQQLICNYSSIAPSQHCLREGQKN